MHGDMDSVNEFLKDKFDVTVSELGGNYIYITYMECDGCDEEGKKLELGHEPCDDCPEETTEAGPVP
jgi:hypothetical protein